jgi:hypothetical protein
MKPFDLEAAKAGAKLVTRDGRAATKFNYDPSDVEGYRCTALVDAEVAGYHESGRYYRTLESCWDLFVDTSRTMYVNLFPDGVAYWFDTEAEARAGLNARALKIAVPVTYEV